MLIVTQVIKWYQLLHSKYKKSHPEMKLSIYIDDDDKAEADASFKAKPAPPRDSKYNKYLCPVLHAH